MKLIAIILAVIILAGCSSDDSTADANSDTESHLLNSSAPAPDNPTPDSSDQDPMTEPEDIYRRNQPIEVLDKDGKHIGEMENSGFVTVTDKGILYTAFADTETTKKQEYCLFDPKTGKTQRLGWIEGEVFENIFNRVEIDGHVYTLAVVGDMLDDVPDTAYLVDIDMNGLTAIHTLSDDAFPYMAMCRHNDKLLIMLHDDQPDALYDRVFEYDPKTGNKKEVITATLNDDEKGDTLRQVWSDGEKVYVLRVKMNTRSDVKLFIDTYDGNYSKQSEQDISGILRNACTYVTEDSDVFNEMLQMVAHFCVIDGKYVYYENFSTTRFLVDLGTGKPLIENNSLLTAVNGSGKIFWYWAFGGSETGDEAGLNAIFELKDGTVEKSLLNDPSGSKYQIYNASESPNGTSLFYMGYKDPETGEELTPRLFLVTNE